MAVRHIGSQSFGTRQDEEQHWRHWGSGLTQGSFVPVGDIRRQI